MSVVIDGTLGITSPAETVQGALTTTGNTILGDATTDTLNVGAGGLVKDASGNVGIGTTAGTTTVSSGLAINNATAANYPGLEIQTAGVTRMYFNANNAASYIASVGANPLAIYTNSAERMRIDSSGNVGIGTAAPSDRLQIEKASANCLLSVSRTTGGAGGRLVMQHTDSVGALQTTASVPLTFGTNDTERMRIDSGGALIVGATSLTNWASNGINAKTTTGGQQCFSGWNADTTGTRYYAYFGTGSTFVANGSITTTGTNCLFNSLSDVRFKENIIDSGSSLEKINNIKIRSFNWISTKEQVDFGVIAQELYDVAPESVTKGDENLDENGNVVKPWAVDTSVLVPALIKSVQELKAIVDAQAVRIAALEV
jgi:hypothetical protein